MKVDFDGQKMAISFDKVPRFLYFNENDEGCGAVFLDGQRVKALTTVDLHARSNDEQRNPLSYNIGFYDRETHEEKAIARGKAAINQLTVGVKVMDMEPFRNMVEIMKQYAVDERIPKEIRKEFIDKIFNNMGA